MSIAASRLHLDDFLTIFIIHGNWLFCLCNKILFSSNCNDSSVLTATSVLRLMYASRPDRDKCVVLDDNFRFLIFEYFYFAFDRNTSPINLFHNQWIFHWRTCGNILNSNQNKLEWNSRFHARFIYFVLQQPK